MDPKDVEDDVARGKTCIEHVIESINAKLKTRSFSIDNPYTYEW